MSVTKYVGTAESCDLRIEDAPYMSSRHFSLTQRDDGSVWLMDEGSTNGTQVRHARGMPWVRVWGPQRIDVGTQILAGRVMFVINPGGQVAMARLPDPRV